VPIGQSAMASPGPELGWPLFYFRAEVFSGSVKPISDTHSLMALVSKSHSV